MIMKYLKILPAWGIILVLSSCVLSYNYQAEILIPAQISVSSEIVNVAVFNRHDISERPKVSLSNMQKNKIFGLDSILLKQAVIGLEDGLIESPRFVLLDVKPKRLVTSKAPVSFSELSWNLLERYCSDTTDMLVELVRAGVQDTILDTDTTDLRVNNYYCVITTAFWRLYDMRYKKISLYRIQDTVKIEKVVGDYSTKYFGDMMEENFSYSMYKAGNRFSQGIAPCWAEINRTVYKSALPGFRDAGQLVSNGKWMEAAEIWKPYCYIKSRFVASRACWNMALASEMNDNFELALEWLKESKRLGLNENVDDYKMIITDRINQRTLLDQQMDILN